MNKLLSILILLMLIPATLLANDKTTIKHNSKMDHSQHNSIPRTPIEEGQDGFAAIAEIAF
ncbi:MAG: hypothetical protein ACI88H_002941 [Cocleimonas sp.]|jgi:hypothetical protein